ncbi:MAG: zinc transport system ATP-binding protein [Clostridiales bacterium]|jgi:zinc transport system ATP-binding protein|nr:zinc transport system ATP-binding protein [Clostridiales bacterium]MDN5281627.1 zinc transport system ATP-binding protein [Candidatus Ozemobacter sp.]
MSEEKEVIRFDNVDFAYDRGSLVLEKINLTISAGDFACIVGPNGGGKTTLLKLILGLLKPVSGTIKVLGTDPKDSLHKIGYVPQQSKFDSSFPVSVLDVVLMGCLNRSFFWGGYSAEQKQKALLAIEEVGMSEFVNRSFADLSGGQRQRTLVARAMVSEPQIILLDEPTSNVDIHGTEQFYNMFEELNRKFTIIMVSHDIGFVSNRVKSVICVRQTLQVHPISELTGETLQNLYGSGVHAIRHDHRCSEGGHSCLHS